MPAPLPPMKCVPHKITGCPYCRTRPPMQHFQTIPTRRRWYVRLLQGFASAALVAVSLAAFVILLLMLADDPHW